MEGWVDVGMLAVGIECAEKFVMEVKLGGGVAMDEVGSCFVGVVALGTGRWVCFCCLVELV